MSDHWQLNEGEARALFAMRRSLASYFHGRVPQHDLEDIVHATIYGVARYWRRGCSLRAFVRLVADRQIIESHRRKQRRVRAEPVEWIDLEDAGHVDAGPGPQTWMQASMIVKSARTKMPTCYREAFDLWLAGLDNVQIAARLGICHRTARSRLARARAMLRAECKATDTD